MTWARRAPAGVVVITLASPLVFARTHDNRMPYAGAGSGGGRSSAINRRMSRQSTYSGDRLHRFGPGERSASSGNTDAKTLIKSLSSSALARSISQGIGLEGSATRKYRTTSPRRKIASFRVATENCKLSIAGIGAPAAIDAAKAFRPRHRRGDTRPPGQSDATAGHGSPAIPPPLAYTQP